MIRRHVLGFNDSDSGGPRWGSCVIFYDYADKKTIRETVIIDGYNSGTGSNKLRKRLKTQKITSPWLYLTHPHSDHLDGLREIIEDSWFKPKGFCCYDPNTIKSGAEQNSAIRRDRNALLGVIETCKKRGIPVTYLHSSDVKQHGDIKFKIYREQPAFEGNKEDPNGWSYLNDGSLIFWFWELATLVTGDGPMQIGEFCKKRDIHAKDFQIPHHGNNCNQGRSAIMKSLGAIYCWDDSYDSGTEFLHYGRQRCIEAGLKFYGIHGDINTIYFGKRAVIYKNGKIMRYACSYAGKAALSGANSDVVRKVMQSKYDNSDARTTKLLDEGYNPGLVQKSVNQVITLAADIWSGAADYGKNEERINRIDKELGKGYGVLVQDYINVLAGVRKSV